MTDPVCRMCQRPLGQHSHDTRDICNMFIEEGPDDIVGHKTFATGEIDPETGLPAMRHEPLTRAEGEKMWAHAQRCHEDRVARMPDEKSALNVMHDAYIRLKDMGWRDAIYCPKDGSTFEIIEAGSTGIFRAHYTGEWPTGSWWAEDAGDLWPSRPTLFRLLPEDQAKEDARRAELRKRFAEEERLNAPITNR